MTLRDSLSFERSAVRAVCGGAVAGVLVPFVTSFSVGDFLFWPLLGPAVLVAVALGQERGRGLLLLMAFVAPVAGLSGSVLSSAVTAGAVSGSALVWARLRAQDLDVPLTHAARVAAGIVGGGILGAVAEGTGIVLFTRLDGLGVPLIPALVLAGGAAGLILVVAQLPAHFAADVDALAERVSALRPSLTDRRLRTLALDAVALHKDCAEFAARLPRDAGRAELLASLGRLVSGALDQAERLAQVQDRADESRLEVARAHAERLQGDVERAEDLVVRQHLEVALDAAREDLSRLEALRVEQARLWARLEAEVALLGRARASLEDVQGGRQALQSAELTALSRKLESLSRSQALEADVMAEVAVGAELDQLAGSASARAQLSRS